MRLPARRGARTGRVVIPSTMDPLGCPGRIRAAFGPFAASSFYGRLPNDKGASNRCWRPFLEWTGRAETLMARPAPGRAPRSGGRGRDFGRRGGGGLAGGG